MCILRHMSAHSRNCLVCTRCRCCVWKNDCRIFLLLLLCILCIRCVLPFLSSYWCSQNVAPQAYLVGGEIPNNQLRPFTYGIGTAVNFLGVWLCTFTAPYFINPAKLGWAAKYGYIWFGSNVVAAIFVLVFVPETRDRTLEEIHEMFEAKLRVGQFKSYVCVGVENFATEGKAKADQILGEKDLQT